ncbi:uncharacterized protein CLUP02_00381 [Colletotrichum lupini]|uniref:Uncharacterized protein n=1 Tax=Colletotrichum lupini TaxID=145971 RepID=A0A9Q8SAY5_9PEZI|nr:uncharacterized protein CLUP02_00381 [Colletotrichum lupini]UQC73735.1 hypothetical protein CLUP02_00381 [Colletotrichum lupini]
MKDQVDVCDFCLLRNSYEVGGRIVDGNSLGVSCDDGPFLFLFHYVFCHTTCFFHVKPANIIPPPSLPLLPPPPPLRPAKKSTAAEPNFHRDFSSAKPCSGPVLLFGPFPTRSSHLVSSHPNVSRVLPLPLLPFDPPETSKLFEPFRSCCQGPTEAMFEIEVRTNGTEYTPSIRLQPVARLPILAYCATGTPLCRTSQPDSNSVIRYLEVYITVKERRMKRTSNIRLEFSIYTANVCAGADLESSDYAAYQALSFPLWSFSILSKKNQPSCFKAL